MSPKAKNKIEEKTENLSYVFPRSEEIIIHRSDLQIQLEKFKRRIRSSFSIFDLLAIISLWSPIFSSDFKELLGLSSKELQVGYAVFACLITLFIISSRAKYFIAQLWRKEDVSQDSKEMVEKILNQCRSECKNTK